MPDKKFDLGGYVEVRDRIKVFYELYGQGRLVTGEVRLTTEPDGKPRVLVQAAAYRSPDDPQPGIGWSWMELPGTTSYTKGSELENTETSAWGRAIAALGILVDRSIASAQEVGNKATGTPEADGGRPAAGARASEVEAPAAAPPQSRAADPDGLIGTVEVGKPSARTDYELRQTPDDGYSLGFRLVSKAGGIKVIATGYLAEELQAYREQVVGQLVTCWGRITTETFRPANAQRDVTYQQLALERIRVPGLGDLPMPVPETVPLFDEETERELDAAAAGSA